MRQETPEYRAAAKLLSEGRTLEGFDGLDRLGWIKEVGVDDDRYRQVAADYLQARADKKSVLVVSPTHAEAARVTQEIRAGLRQCGQLGKDGPRLHPAGRGQDLGSRTRRSLHLPARAMSSSSTRTARASPRAIASPSPIRRRCRSPKPVSSQLYRPEPIALAKGDIIRFTATVKTLDGEHKLYNGASKTVAGFTKNGDLKLDNGWVVAKDAGHFRHGFVETSFGSQGKTVQRVILAVAESSLPAANQEQMYVGASRARQLMTLYTDNKAAVRRAVQRSSKKLAALDIRPPDEAAAKREKKRLRQVRKRRRAYWERSREEELANTPIHPNENERQVSYGR